MTLRAPLKMKTLAVRFVFFLGVWLMIASWKAEDLPVGLVASALALWISLSLLPPSVVRPRLAALAKLSLRFLSSSIIAGVDVARRALLPRLDLRPGFVAVPLPYRLASPATPFSSIRAFSRELRPQARKAKCFRCTASTFRSR